MSMAAGAAVLRSLATQMGRAPPRLPTSSGGLCHASRFSTSAGGSMPPSANLSGPQPHNKKDPSDSQWFRAIVAFNKAAPTAAFAMIGVSVYVHCTVIPTLDRMQAHTEAQIQSCVTMREEIKKSSERTEAAAVSEAQADDQQLENRGRNYLVHVEHES